MRSDKEVQAAAASYLFAERLLKRWGDLPALAPEAGAVLWSAVNRQRRLAKRILIEAIERTGRPVYWGRRRFTLDSDTGSLAVARTPRLRLLRRPEPGDRLATHRLVPAG